MTDQTLALLKHPIGSFQWNENPNSKEIKIAIKQLEDFPVKIKKSLTNVPKQTMLSRYRPEGWTIAQVVHHLADSHMHCYMRFKHALLEDTPSIKDYKEADWASMEDASQVDISYSIDLLTALHKRWTLFLKLCTEKELSRAYFHPERNKHYPLHTSILLYAWHGEHHIAHIENAKKNGF
ncbi:MAG: hypothetical protein ACI9TK_000666 [Flavobacteriaceae bacterium]|jgi:hypothetical protein|tara:strand:+ start:3098 stop:3637 length:540 start_codon:yes stop_codon:yes gene_type:complete